LLVTGRFRSDNCATIPLSFARHRKDIGYRLEERTGLLHCNISLVENGHTVPSVTTLDKIAAALEMPLYELLYDGHEPPASHRATKVEGMG
jgi:transcriptional regulator with XRE-family HTH domain